MNELSEVLTELLSPKLLLVVWIMAMTAIITQSMWIMRERRNTIHMLEQTLRKQDAEEAEHKRQLEAKRQEYLAALAGAQSIVDEQKRELPAITRPLAPLGVEEWKKILGDDITVSLDEYEKGK